MRRSWREEWQEHAVAAYAAANSSLISRFASRVDDESLENQVAQQNAWTLAGLFSVDNISDLGNASGAIAHVAELYKEDETELMLNITDLLEDNLTGIYHALEIWLQKVAIALGSAQDPNLERLLRQAQIDYGMAQFRVLEELQQIEEQIELCSHLVWWMRYTGDEDSAIEYGKHLVLLLQAQGLSHEAAKALFQEGSYLFLSKSYKEAAAKFIQASEIAKQTNDENLLDKCEEFLGFTKYF